MALAGGSWAPWVDRAAAALVLTAPDLAEFVKFLPEVRCGALVVQRLCFLGPLFVVLVTTPCVIGARSLDYPGWLRGLVLAVAATLALLLLPPVWSPPVLLADEFRLQTAGCVLCWGLPVTGRAPGRVAPALACRSAARAVADDSGAGSCVAGIRQPHYTGLGSVGGTGGRRHDESGTLVGTRACA